MDENKRRIEEVEDFIQTKYGYCFYEVKKESALVYNLFVHPEHRGVGKAKVLLGYVINEIREAGYKGKIEIEALPKEGVDITRLVLFYEKIGLTIRSSIIF